MTYPETVQYLESFINYEKIPAYPYKESLKLERIKGFLSSIDNPQDNLNCIHIAGTKGKGSTCVFVAYILREAGYNAGFYTSPHLADFRERIRILKPAANGERLVTDDFEGMISQGELSEIVKRLNPAIERYNKNSPWGPLSFFEVYTALAFVYFKEKKVDFAVLETGLGGRLDATNVVNPLVAAITPISYEHTQKLGNTLREIATEKAGIIKTQNLIVISAPQEKEVLEVIEHKCKEAGAKLYAVGKDITYKRTKDGFNVRATLGEYPDLQIRLLGNHQLINATVAVGIIEALKSYNINPVRNTKAIINEDKISNGVNVDINSLKNGLYNTRWPGRCEIIARSPLVILDGAQNVSSMRALRETIRECARYKRLILVLGISSDKDIKGICSQLDDLADEIILTCADNPRAAEPRILAGYFKGKSAHITKSVNEAKALAHRLAEREDLILVCGSLFVVGEYRHGKI